MEEAEISFCVRSVCVQQSSITPGMGPVWVGWVHCPQSMAKRFGATKNMQAWGAVNDAEGQNISTFSQFLNLLLGPKEPSVPQCLTGFKYISILSQVHLPLLLFNC